MNKLARAILAAVAVVAIVGCSPDELELTIPTSALARAQTGEVGKAKASVSFQVETWDVKSKLPQIREAVMPFLGKGGKMTVRGDKIVANFNVPVVPVTYHGYLQEEPLARLVYRDGRLTFEPTLRMRTLNSRLGDIDFSLDADFNAKHVVFKIVGDSTVKCRAKAIAVFIDGAAKVQWDGVVEEDDSVDIEFRCDSDASIWKQINPFLFAEPIR